MPRFTLGCTGVHPQRVTHQHDAARRFNSPTITALLASHGHQRAIRKGGTLQVVDIAPEHDGAAIAASGCRGVEGHRSIECRTGSLRQRATALPVAAHQHAAAAGGSCGVHAGVVGQANVITGERDGAATTTA